jgi:hypothetical protein
MRTITIPRPDVTSEVVSAALRQGLSPRYHVLPGERISQDPINNSNPDQTDTILVGTGSNRLFRAEVTISRGSRQTILHIRPGGLPGTWPGGLKFVNRLGTARKVHRVLQATPRLH